MARLTLSLALLGSVLGSASLWLTVRAADAHAAELRRIEATRLEQKQSLVAMSAQIAELRSGLAARITGEQSSEAMRAPVIPTDVAFAPHAAEVHANAAELVEGPPSDSIDLAQRFRGLTEEAKKEALEDLLDRARWGDEKALSLLIEALDDASPEVREKAAKKLGDLADPALVGYLKQAAADPSEDVRAAVAESLEKMPADDAGPILVQMLRDRDPEVVEEAIKSLAKLDYQKARPFLIDQLSSDDLDLATRAAAALRGMGEESAILATIDRIMKDYARGHADRIHDVKWLRRVGGATAIAQLRTILETDPSPDVREEARKALEKLEN